MAGKTATLPSLRVEPELRAAAEALLKDGETLSGFVEESVRRQIHLRRTRDEFLARGLRSLADVENGGKTYPAEDVLAEIDEIVARAKSRA